MITFNRENYRHYRLMVQAKCSGADVHFVNGELGKVLNGCVNYEGFVKHNLNTAEYREGIKDGVIHALIELKKRTGVFEEFEYFFEEVA